MNMVPVSAQDSAELFQRGNALFSSGRFEEAAGAYLELIARDPLAADAWHNLGHASRQIDSAEAEHAFRAAVRLAPGNNDFLYSLAEFYLQQERFQESLTLCRKVLESDPADIRAWVGAGHACQRMFLLDEARACYEESLARVPGDPFALNNLGVIFRELGLLEQSRSCFETIIAADPGDGDAHWNLSHTLLLEGNLAAGWKEYEWRFCRTTAIPLPPFSQPRWQGEDLSGRTILLWAEQAYGDTIQFIRFAPLLAARGATVLVEVPDTALRRLIQFVSGVSGVIVRGEKLPRFDCWAPLMSLPLHLGIELTSIPADIPYLCPPPELTSSCKDRLPDAQPRIGLVWAGRSRPDPRRSCPASEFSRFAGLELPVRWFLLQVGGSQDDKELLCSHLGAVDLSPQFTDFAETAGVIADLDLVITIDSAVAHLAGALGKETWLLLPFAPDWRWFLERSDSPWYPTMRIFRQKAPAGWSELVDEVMQSLALYAGRQEQSAAPPTVDLMIAMGDEARQDERWEDAAACYRKALTIDPESALATLCLGGSLIFLKRPEEARGYLRRAVELEPENVDAHLNLAMASLAMGDFSEGWREFDWRLRNIEQPLPEIPMLDADAVEQGITGLTVLVHAEQGLGDMLQFCRYLPILSSCGAKVVASVPVPLVSLFAGITGVDRVIPHGELLPPADFQCLLMSLPLLLEGVCPEIPAAVPYLSPPEELVRLWSNRLPDDGRLKVGIVWGGRDMRKSGYRRSLRAEDYRCIIGFPGIALFSLQTGDRAAEISMLGGGVADLSGEIADFADTAAIIDNLDLVLTVDTSVAHLAGAMGKQVWVALLHAPDWRWLPNSGEITPWYPTMRLFRQESPGDWAGVMLRIEETLRPLLKEHLRCRAMERYEAGNLSDAARLFEALLALHPGDADALFCLGTIALREGDPVAAERHFMKLAAEDPDADCLNNLGHALGNQGRFDEAIAAFRRAVEIDPQHAGGWLNLGIYLHAAGRHRESRDTLLHLVSMKPDYAEGWQNLALAHQASGEIGQAFAAIGNALRIRPDYPMATWNLALLQLLCGNCEDGFRNFEARFSKAGAIASRFSSIPRWQGDEITGRSLLVHAEQGFGDTIQFLRYLPLLEERGIPVVMEVQDESLRLTAESVPGGQRVIVRGEDPGNPEFQIPLLSLPMAFGTDLRSIPTAPYLFMPEPLLAKWGQRFAGTGRYRVGIVWRGRSTPDPYRSISVELLAPLLELPGIGWYSLQVEEAANREAPPPIDRSHVGELTDFAETAACMQALDLVITIDTATAHLAGALGVPAWVLLPFVPDWRWLLDREDSPWYPSMRLFRQTSPRDWQGVVQRVVGALTMVLQEKKRDLRS